MRIAKTLRVAVLGTVAATFGMSTFTVPASAENANQKIQRKEGEIPHCATKKGSIAIYEPKENWWTPLNLESPQAVLKVIVLQSGCFTLVDRGRGFDIAQQERAMASNGDLQQGSNIGKGQVKAADYVMVPDIMSKNDNASGTNIGAALGGFIGGGFGAIVGGINIKKATADVTLSVTDVRSGEILADEQAHGSKTDVGWSAGGGMFAGWGGGLGVSSYTNTAIGQVIILAYIEAYTKLVSDLGLLPANASAANVIQAVTAKHKLFLRANATGKGVVKMLDAGAMLYPTGNQSGDQWEVKDEMGAVGWVNSDDVTLSK